MADLTDVEPPGEDEIWVVVGPTGTGKTALAIALAQAFNGEVVGADSMQIYREFGLGTGKPSEAERRSAAHHLVDCTSAREPWDAAIWVAAAEAAIAEIRGRRRLPIVAGGTYLWVKALLYGLAEGAPSSQELRQSHEAFAQEFGRPALHKKLAQVDPQSAERLHPNDLHRVSRALEVFELTGRTMSEVQKAHQFREGRFRHRKFTPLYEREALDRRLLARCEAWFEAGWVEEVRELRRSGLGACRAMSSVGYRQIAEYLASHGDESNGTPELREKVYRATRTYVRRQRTWLREVELHGVQL